MHTCIYVWLVGEDVNSVLAQLLVWPKVSENISYILIFAVKLFPARLHNTHLSASLSDMYVCIYVHAYLVWLAVTVHVSPLSFSVRLLGTFIYLSLL